MSSGPFVLNSWDRSSTIEGVIGNILLLPCFVEILELNAKSINPYQTLRSVASDLGLYCLPNTLLWNAGHKCVKDFKRII